MKNEPALLYTSALASGAGESTLGNVRCSVHMTPGKQSPRTHAFCYVLASHSPGEADSRQHTSVRRTFPTTLAHRSVCLSLWELEGRVAWAIQVSAQHRLEPNT